MVTLYLIGTSIRLESKLPVGEHMLQWIIEAYKKNGFNETHMQVADNSEKWIKSLKDRIQPQLKQEK